MYYSVMVVEDEALLRNKFLQSIDWKSCQCRVVCECDSAEKAIEYVNEHGFPDILFTDIHLLKMDGIELCRYFYERNPATRKIITTGYDYFNYAKQAIVYGVKHYALKPMDINDMYEVLASLTNAIFAERHNHQELEGLKHFVQKNRLSMVENFLIELSCSNNALSDSGYGMMTAHLDLNLSGYYYAVIRYKCEATESSLEIKLQLKNCLYEQMSFYGECYCFTFEYGKISCIFVPRGNVVIEDIIEMVFSKIPLFNQTLWYSAGISERQENYTTIRKAYEQAAAAVGYDFYFGSGSVIPYQDIFEDQKNNPSSLEVFDSEAIIGNLRVGDWGKSVAILAHRFGVMKQERSITLQVLQTASIELTFIIHNSVYANNTQLTIPNLTDDIYCISQTASLDEMQEVMTGIITACGVQMQQRFLNHTHSAVVKILAYLNDHYYEQISLEDLGKVVYMNTKYICNIIKKDTGKTFHEILVGIRIDKAKFLMKNLNYKMYEISRMVGFNDVKGFNSAFKKSVGMTPTEYRNYLSEVATSNLHT